MTLDTNLCMVVFSGIGYTVVDVQEVREWKG